MTRRTARRAEEPREIILVSLEPEPRHEQLREHYDSVRFGARQAAEALGYHVVERPARNYPGWINLCAAQETEREQVVIAEGLAMVQAAARERPELLDRYAYLRQAKPAGAGV